MRIARVICRLTICAAVALLLAGPAAAGDPVMSLHPLHPGRETVVEPLFEGEWVYASEGVKLIVTRDKNWPTGKVGDSYRLEFHIGDGKETLRFEARLVRLGSTVFADIQQTSDTGVFALYPHVFAKIKTDVDELRFEFLDKDFVENALENGRTDLAHESADGTLVLTAATRELQDFVESSAFDDEAFDEEVSFTRLKAEPGGSN